MDRLINKLYGTRRSPRSHLFGLKCGQRRVGEVLIKKAGWFNRKGQKMGYGDLDASDFAEIARGLQADESFIIIPEYFCSGMAMKEIGDIDEALNRAIYVLRKDEFYIMQGYIAKSLIIFKPLNYDMARQLVNPVVCEPKVRIPRKQRRMRVHMGRSIGTEVIVGEPSY